MRTPLLFVLSIFLCFACSKKEATSSETETTPTKAAAKTEEKVVELKHPCEIISADQIAGIFGIDASTLEMKKEDNDFLKKLKN